MKWLNGRRDLDTSTKLRLLMRQGKFGIWKFSWRLKFTVVYVCWIIFLFMGLVS
jgi:hypothetical protein